MCWGVTVFTHFTPPSARLRTVARDAALVAETKSDIQVIAAPLLGTGAGGADPMKSAAAIVEGILELRRTGPHSAPTCALCVAGRGYPALPSAAPFVDVPRAPTITDFTGAQFGGCEEAFEDAFTKFALRHMVKIGLDKDLDAIAGGDSLKEVIFNLLLWAEKER